MSTVHIVFSNIYTSVVIHGYAVVHKMYLMLLLFVVFQILNSIEYVVDLFIYSSIMVKVISY